LSEIISFQEKGSKARAAAVHLNFRAGSTFPVPVCAVSPGNWVNKADTQGLAGATRLTRSDFRLNLLLRKGQRCVKGIVGILEVSVNMLGHSFN